jgi:hypothetical protein
LVDVPKGPALPLCAYVRSKCVWTMMFVHALVQFVRVYTTQASVLLRTIGVLLASIACLTCMRRKAPALIFAGYFKLCLR